MSLVDDKRTHSRTVRELQAKATLMISKEVMMQIHYLHHRVDRNTEWSGVLIYETISGNINDPKNWVIGVKEIIPMDVGSSGYTEYEINPDDEYSSDKWMDALEQGKKMGHIHTHHNMGTFFSGTDMSELHDNAPKHNYYLSLIVDYKDHDAWMAKVAICGEIERSGKIITKMTTKTTWTADATDVDEDIVDEVEEVEDKVPVLYIINCDIKLEESARPFCERVSKLNSEKGTKFSGLGGFNGNFTTSQTRNTNYAGKVWDVKLQAWVPESWAENVTADKKEGTTETTKRTVQSTGLKFTSWSDKEKDGKHTELMYAPGKVRGFLGKLIAQDEKYEGEVLTIFEKSKHWKTEEIKDLLDLIEDSFEENVARYFGLKKCEDVDAHCVAVSIMDIIEYFSETRFYKGIKDIMNGYILPAAWLPADITKELTGISKYELQED